MSSRYDGVRIAIAAARSERDAPKVLPGRRSWGILDEDPCKGQRYREASDLLACKHRHRPFLVGGSRLDVHTRDLCTAAAAGELLAGSGADLPWLLLHLPLSGRRGLPGQRVRPLDL